MPRLYRRHRRKLPNPVPLAPWDVRGATISLDRSINVSTTEYRDADPRVIDLLFRRSLPMPE